MTQRNECQEQQALARRITQSMALDEREKFRLWVAKLVGIKSSNLDTFTKAKQAVASTVSDGVAISLARLLATELQRVGWKERGLKWKVGFATAVVAAVVTGGQGAGIAALGGAVGVPLWLVLGAGGSFLAMLYEELGGAKKAALGEAAEEVSRTSSAYPNVGSSTAADTRAADVLDVVAKEVRHTTPQMKAKAVSTAARMTPDPEIWVGELDGDLLFFDLSIQIKDGPHVFLWSSKTRTMERFVPSLLRTHIRRYKNPMPPQDLHRPYLEWFEQSGKSWLAEAELYDRTRAHQVPGKRIENQGAPRPTHCYQCREPLVSTMDRPCSDCGWLTCSSCDACGCGHTSRKR
jgi:hypothetical protein